MTNEPIFKGATRPPCVWGVPMNAFIGVSGVIVLLAMWIYIPLLLALPIAIFVMRKITEDDDQRFHQLFLYVQTHWVGFHNRGYWKNVTSLSATDYRQKKN